MHYQPTSRVHSIQYMISRNTVASFRSWLLFNCARTIAIIRHHVRAADRILCIIERSRAHINALSAHVDRIAVWRAQTFTITIPKCIAYRKQRQQHEKEQDQQQCIYTVYTEREQLCPPWIYLNRTRPCGYRATKNGTKKHSIDLILCYLLCYVVDVVAHHGSSHNPLSICVRRTARRSPRSRIRSRSICFSMINPRAMHADVRDRRVCVSAA